MGKLLRIFSYILGLMLLLLLAAVIIIPMVVDPNDYKDEIADAVQSNTGRTLTMEGDLHLSVFPWLGLEIGPTSLSNATGFSKQPFAEVQAVQLRVKLLPLLRKELEMDTVQLKGLRVSLETNAKGETNWADLAGEAEPAKEKTGATGGEERPEPEAGKMALASLAIGGVEITEAGVVWDDRKNNARYEVDGLTLRTGAIAPGKTVPVELKLQLASTQPPINGPVQFNARVALSADQQIVTLSDAQLNTDLKGEMLPAGRFQSELGFNTELNLKTGQLDLTGLLLKALGLRLEGALAGKELFSKPAFNGELKIKEFVPREVIQALGQPVPEVSDPVVLGKADASLKLAATQDSVQVSDLQLRLDDSTIHGNMKVAQFAKPAVRFDLQLDEIDVDRYLPPPTEKAPPPATPATAAAAATQLFPVETIRALDIDGRMRIDKLKAAQLRSTDIDIPMHAKEGVVRVFPAKAKMYQGQYQGDLQLDARGKQPRVSMNERLSGVQVGPLLKDLTGDDKLSGRTEAQAKLSASGQSPDELKRTLNGDLSFTLTEGAVKGFNLAAMIRKAQAQLKGKPIPADNEPNQTDFSELTGTGQVTNGVIHNQDLLAKSPLLRVEGKGSVDLPREKLDYKVTAKIVSSLEGQGGKGLADLRGIPIPVDIGGTFAEPTYRIRLDEVVKGKAEKKAKKEIEKQREKLEEKLGDKLKGLFQ